MNTPVIVISFPSAGSDALETLIPWPSSSTNVYPESWPIFIVLVTVPWTVTSFPLYPAGSLFRSSRGVVPIPAHPKSNRPNNANANAFFKFNTCREFGKKVKMCYAVRDT